MPRRRHARLTPPGSADPPGGSSWLRRRHPGITLGALAVAAAVVLPALVAAATSTALRDLAASYSMNCVQDANNWTCTRDLDPELWTTYIAPVSGDEQYLDTLVSTPNLPLAASTTGVVGWMVAMHTEACGNQDAVASYVQAVAALTEAANAPSTMIGPCLFSGSLNGVAIAEPLYIVSSSIPPAPSIVPTIPPSPTATPVTTATPAASQSPTPAATAVTATATPVPSPSVAVTGSPSIDASPSVGASPSAAAPSIIPISTGVPAPSASDVPTPSSSPAPGGGPAPTPTQPTFAGAVLDLTAVNTEPVAFSGSLVLALLMLLFIGFVGELFNNTVENNYDEISGWFGKSPLRWLRGAGGALGALWGGPLGLVLFLALTALVSAFVDPSFGLDLRSLAEFLGFLVGLIVVLVSFKLPGMLARRRATGDFGRLKPLPWALVIAIAFVLVSRIGNLNPGYLYAIVLGAVFVREVSARDEGRETFYGSVWTLVAAVAGWLGLSWLAGLGLPADGFGSTLLATAFAAIVVGGLEATAFGLMPLRFMPGYAVYQWNRLGWALLFGISVVAFVHLLVGPTSGYVSELSPAAFVAALGVFAAFGALSIGTWLFFRLRQPAAAAPGP